MAPHRLLTSANPLHGSCQRSIQRSCGSCSEGSLHVRMPRVTITPHLHPLPHLHPFSEMASGFGSFHPPSHPRGDHAPCSQVTCDSPSNPAHHARPLVSALPPREAARSTATLHRKRCPLTPQRAEARTTCELRVTVTPAPSCKGHSTSYRSLRASRVTDCARATAMVVKRKTRNEGNTHHTPVVPRVQPLLKCAPSCCVRTESLMDERPAATTLNVACSWTAPITTVSHSSSSISSSQSHSSSSQLSHSLCFDPTQRRWLASHSCEAGLSQCHPHIARYNYHTTTCQQLPTLQRETLHHAAQPLSTGWVHTRHSGCLMIEQHHVILRVAT